MRKGTKVKQASLSDADLDSKELHRALLYGQASHLAGVIQSMAAVRVNPEAGEAHGFTKFLGEWLSKATPSKLRLIADYLESLELTENRSWAADPVAWRLIEYGRQIQNGGTIREALASASSELLMDAIRSRGIPADWSTVRKTLNRLGVKRPRGRPKKSR